MRKLFIIVSLFLTINSSCLMAEFVSEQDQLKLQREEIRNAHFKNIDELVSLRAPGLALSYVRREQVQYDKEDPTEWLYWEQKHVSLLAYTQQWKVLVQRVNQQLDNLQTVKIATADRNWFLSEQIRALIKLKKYTLALQKLRSLLWNTSKLTGSADIATWRRLIIQVYINQDRLDDARIAMRRYQQDYGELKNEDGMSWLQVQAELYIQSAQYNEAISILNKIEATEVKTLTLLAELKAEHVSPSDALTKSQLLLKNSETNQQKSLFAYVSLVSATQADNNEAVITNLEQLLSSGESYLSNSIVNIGEVTVHADDLWFYYLRQGNQIANSKGLLKGDDAGWYALANNLYKTEPYNAKAIFAVMSLQAGALKHRHLAMQQFVSLIEDNEQSLQLVNRLFTQSKYFPDLSMIPAEVRYRLIDYNLSLGSVEAAAVLMAELKQPPEDEDQFEWNLRRARVFILNGDFEQGILVLDEILKAQQLLSNQIDKYMQVIFDLQAVEQHVAALKLFSELEDQLEDINVIRELTFWRAESYHGLKQYEQAAYLFLKSAKSPKKEYDPWYHTATFRAAESLMLAKLYEDARQRFLHLLSITGNAARKTVIRQRLQTIRLNQQVN